MNSNEEPILDFNGNVYDIDLGRHQPALSEHNKMELLNFSRDQKLFLFHDRLEERLYVYELKGMLADCIPRIPLKLVETSRWRVCTFVQVER